jgi:hypothetical protein
MRATLAYVMTLGLSGTECVVARGPRLILPAAIAKTDSTCLFKLFSNCALADFP